MLETCIQQLRPVTCTPRLGLCTHHVSILKCPLHIYITGSWRRALLPLCCISLNRSMSTLEANGPSRLYITIPPSFLLLPHLHPRQPTPINRTKQYQLSTPTMPLFCTPSTKQSRATQSSLSKWTDRQVENLKIREREGSFTMTFFVYAREGGREG